jgi:hypothetical protein
MGKRKLMGQSMDNAALRRCQSGGERHAVALRGLLEKEQLRIELQDLRVVQVNI